MSNEKQYISTEKKKALEEELQKRTTSTRKEILEKLEFAKSLGDLSENAEYHQAREEQAKNEDRIREIESLLKHSVVVSMNSKKKGDTVEIGSTVTVQKKGTKTKKDYQIVGTEEADSVAGKISFKSPLGNALLGKKKGETAVFETPKGAIEYKVVAVS